MTKVLIVDEDPATREVLTTYLRDLFATETCSINDAEKYLRTSRPSLVIFSIEKLFPLKQIVTHLRKNPDVFNTGVLAIVSDANPRTLEFLYECGVDDFLTRPVDFSQLYWKTRSIVRRVEGGFNHSSTTLTLGELELLPTQNEVIINGTETVHVSEIQMKLLVAFHGNPDRLLTRDWMITNVWSGEDISARSIDAQISKLRKNFPQIEPHVLSVYGKGYLWKTKTAVHKTAAS